MVATTTTASCPVALAGAGGATLALLKVQAWVFILQRASRHWLTAWACKHPGALRQGQVWRLVTPTLLHANLAHLLVNGAGLFCLGPVAEAALGPERALLVFFGAGLGANLASYACNPMPAVGSSGAVFGLIGALGAFALRHRALLGEDGSAALAQLSGALALNMAFGAASPNIDNWGHFGGLLSGALLAEAVGPRFVAAGGGPGKRGGAGWGPRQGPLRRGAGRSRFVRLEDRPRLPWLARSAVLRLAEPP